MLLWCFSLWYMAHWKYSRAPCSIGGGAVPYYIAVSLFIVHNTFCLCTVVCRIMAWRIVYRCKAAIFVHTKRIQAIKEAKTTTLNEWMNEWMDAQPAAAALFQQMEQHNAKCWKWQRQICIIWMVCVSLKILKLYTEAYGNQSVFVFVSYSCLVPFNEKLCSTVK